MSIINTRVTRRHINESCQSDAKHCAISQAVLDSDEDLLWVRAETGFLTFARYSDDMVYRYQMPKSGKDFIIAYDNDRNPQPFQFIVNSSAFVSMRPRRLGQAQKHEVVLRRKFVAKTTGRKLADVSETEVEGMVWNEEDMGLVAQPKKVITPAKTRPETKPRNHRKTIAEAMEYAE